MSVCFTHRSSTRTQRQGSTTLGARIPSTLFLGSVIQISPRSPLRMHPFMSTPPHHLSLSCHSKTISPSSIQLSTRETMQQGPVPVLRKPVNLAIALNAQILKSDHTPFLSRLRTTVDQRRKPHHVSAAGSSSSLILELPQWNHLFSTGFAPSPD